VAVGRVSYQGQIVSLGYWCYTPAWVLGYECYALSALVYYYFLIFKIGGMYYVKENIQK
jgi:hypothetical protein